MGVNRFMVGRGTLLVKTFETGYAQFENRRRKARLRLVGPRPSPHQPNPSAASKSAHSADVSSDDTRADLAAFPLRRDGKDELGAPYAYR